MRRSWKSWQVKISPHYTSLTNLLIRIWHYPIYFDRFSSISSIALVVVIPVFQSWLSSYNRMPFFFYVQEIYGIYHFRRQHSLGNKLCNVTKWSQLYWDKLFQDNHSIPSYTIIRQIVNLLNDAAFNGVQNYEWESTNQKLLILLLSIYFLLTLK